MPLFTGTERPFAQAVSRLAFANPFLPERIDAERDALGSEFEPAGAVWSSQAHLDPVSANVAKIDMRVKTLVPRLRERLADGAAAAEGERTLYEDLVLYLMFHRSSKEFFEAVTDSSHRSFPTFRRFEEELSDLLRVGAASPPTGAEAAHLFACLFQVRRAFHEIFTHIVGTSMAAARLRAEVWQSIFTHDMRRYRRTMWSRMGDIATLVMGPSGTGKELVARAIGRSRYVPFDAEALQFTADFGQAFHALNLSALSPTLIESELFGHRKGAFTGAIADRSGWLEVCPPHGTVFLDEIGEVDGAIQVKLLRVLQTRSFQRLGDTETRTFTGKVIAATNRDLAAEMEAGRFREDLYFRLCADLVVTPTLHEQLRDTPQDLHELLLFVARRIAGDEEAEGLAHQVARWIREHLGPDYPWHGNVRELEQCVRNVLIRGAYRPPAARSAPPEDGLAQDMRQGTLTADQLLARYCTMVYARTGSYQETARRLGLDRRTVKAKVEAGTWRPQPGRAGPTPVDPSEA